jgi:hypothetical protein
MEQKQLKKVQKAKAPVKEKLSYEELEALNVQLSEQAKRLYYTLQRQNLEGVFKRLDYLFKILENYTFFDPGFIDDCVFEITTLMKQEEKGEEEEKENSSEEPDTDEGKEDTDAPEAE